MYKLDGKNTRENIIMGIMVSNIGTMAFTTALSLYVLSITNSAVILGSSLLLSAIPILIFSLISGIVADRCNKLSIIVKSDKLRVLLGVIFMLCVPWVDDNIKVILIFLLAIVFSICETFQTTAYQSILPDIVSKDEFIDLNTAISGFGEVISLISPIVATIIYSLFGINGVIVFMVLCIGISIFYESKFPYKFVKHSVKNEEKFLYMLSSELKGLKKLLTFDIRVTSLYFNGFTTHLFLLPFIGIGIPYLVTQIMKGTSIEYGIISSCTAVGGILAIFFVKPLKKFGVSRNILIGIIGMVLGSSMFGFLVFPSILSLFISNSVLGTIYISFVVIIIYLSFGYYGIYFSSFLQQNIDHGSLGKGMSMIMMINCFGRILGYLLFGFLFEYNLTLPIIILTVGMIIKIFIHIPFIIKDKDNKIK